MEENKEQIIMKRKKKIEIIMLLSLGMFSVPCSAQEVDSSLVFESENFENLENEEATYLTFDLSGLNLVDSTDLKKKAIFSSKPAQGVTQITLESRLGSGTFEFLPYLGFHQSTSKKYVGVSTYSQGTDQPTFHTSSENLVLQNIIYTIDGRNLTIELVGSPFGNRIEQWSFILPCDASAYKTTFEFYRGYCDEEKKAVYEVHNLRYQVYDDSYNVAVECAPGNEDEVIVIPASVDINGYRYRVTDIGHRRAKSAPYLTFSKAYNLKKVIVESGISRINAQAFMNCERLEEIVLPSSIQQIEPYVFANCTNLEKISLPSKLKEISPYLFSGCTRLKQVDLPNGIQRICSYAFENCSSLSNLRIPASVQTIEGNANQNLAFWGCSQLIICGDSPSVAQSYAQRYGIPFQKDLPQNTTIIYRLYKQSTGEHFYTDSLSEQKTCLQNSIWKDEGYGWLAPTSSNLPVYRLYNPYTTDHHYTMDQNEYETLQTMGWNGEGIVFYSALPTDESKPLYRLYNPNAQEAGSHHYTLDLAERDGLIKLGWKDEGIAWYAIDHTF